MKLQISVSAASPLTPLGKQVRALESQAAKARKLLDSAKDAEASGKSIDVKLARLKEVLGLPVASAAPKSPTGGTIDVLGQNDFFVLLVESWNKPTLVQVRSVEDATRIVFTYVKRNKLAGNWVGAMVIQGRKVIGSIEDGEFISDANRSAFLRQYAGKALRTFKAELDNNRLMSRDLFLPLYKQPQVAAPAVGAVKGRYVFLAEHVRMSDRLVHSEWVRVRSVADASKKVRAYISKNDLGSSTWMGGLLVEDGTVIGRVGYNGTFEDAAHPDTKMYAKRYATKFLNLLKKQMSSIG